MRKHLLLLVLAALLMVALSSPLLVGRAQGPGTTGREDPTPTPTPVWGPIVQEVEVRTFPEEDLKRVSQITRFDISFYVPAYNQGDPRWSGKIMQTCGTSIGLEGCALTSATMIFGHYGSSMNPDQVNTCMGNYACPWDWSRSSNCTQNKAYYYAMYSFSYPGLLIVMSDGYPPMLELTKPGSKPHWVVVQAVHGGGASPSDYTILDPSGGVYRSLAYYTSQGRSGNNIAVYKPR